MFPNLLCRNDACIHDNRGRLNECRTSYMFIGRALTSSALLTLAHEGYSFIKRYTTAVHNIVLNECHQPSPILYLTFILSRKTYDWNPYNESISKSVLSNN